MNAPLAVTPPSPIVYPDRDGKPMADNTKQARWIVTLFGNIAALFRDRADVFVAADLLWYPVEGQPEERAAPDVLVVFGRPKGDRGSYRQWEEGGVPVTVVFEVLSPGNAAEEMTDKFSFYEEHGVEEYYLYNPDTNHLAIYHRGAATLRRVRPAHGCVSPRMGVGFDLSGPELRIYNPNGTAFLTFEELKAAWEQSERRADTAERRADTAERRADTAERRAARLAELGRKARLGQANEAEMQELERLERESGVS